MTNSNAFRETPDKKHYGQIQVHSLKNMANLYAPSLEGGGLKNKAFFLWNICNEFTGMETLMSVLHVILWSLSLVQCLDHWWRQPVSEVLIQCLLRQWTFYLSSRCKSEVSLVQKTSNVWLISELKYVIYLKYSEFAMTRYPVGDRLFVDSSHLSSHHMSCLYLRFLFGFVLIAHREICLRKTE